MAARLLGRFGLRLLEAINRVERSIISFASFSSGGRRAAAVGIDVSLGSP